LLPPLSPARWHCHSLLHMHSEVAAAAVGMVVVAAAGMVAAAVGTAAVGAVGTAVVVGVVGAAAVGAVGTAAGAGAVAGMAAGAGIGRPTITARQRIITRLPGTIRHRPTTVTQGVIPSP